MLHENHYLGGREVFRGTRKEKAESEMAHKNKMTCKKKKLYQSTSGRYYKVKTRR
jgi:hypothetical protein